MKVVFIEIPYGTNVKNWVRWKWCFGEVVSFETYTRRRDARRGFERFCRAIKGVK